MYDSIRFVCRSSISSSLILDLFSRVALNSEKLSTEQSSSKYYNNCEVRYCHVLDVRIRQSFIVQGLRMMHNYTYSTVHDQYLEW